MAKKQAPKIVSKKHLARQERERRQIRAITGVSIGVVAIVLLGILYGILNNTFLLRYRSAVSVNGQSLSLHEFQVQVRATRQSLISQYMQYMQLAQMFGIDPTTDSSMSQSLNQITSELNSSTTIGSQVIDNMVNSLLIRQYAKANGIVVTQAEVDKAIQNAVGYFPNGTPTPTLTPTSPVYPTLNPTQLALVSPTPTATLEPTSTPRPTSTPNPSATATPVPSLTPTATPYTLQGFETQYQNLRKNYAPSGATDAEFRTIYFEDGLYSDKVKAKVTADVPNKQDEVWARDIEVPDEVTANSVYTLLSNGADFATVAKNFSIDTATKDNGGDMGWFAKGTQPADLEAAIWPMKVGVINPPVKTSTGYFVIQVLGHEIRPLTADAYNTAVTDAFNNWLQTERSNSKVVINDSWTNYVPTTPTLEQALTDQGATVTAYVATAQAQLALTPSPSPSPSPTPTK